MRETNNFSSSESDEEEDNNIEIRKSNFYDDQPELEL
jgi:hypothetical protein